MEKLEFTVIKCFWPNGKLYLIHTWFLGKGLFEELYLSILYINMLIYTEILYTLEKMMYSVYG